MIKDDVNYRDKIKCGSCNSEYYRRLDEEASMFSTVPVYDSSCPVCGYSGQIQETTNNFTKILLD